MFIEINVLYTVYSERGTLDVALVPGCLIFNISSHKVSPNSKGWAWIWRRGVTGEFTVPIRLTRPDVDAYSFEEVGIWVSIRRPFMFSLEIIERTRLTQAQGGGGVPPSLSRARIACVQCSPVFEKKKKTTSVNRLEDKEKQHVQFLRHNNYKNIF